VVSDQALDEKTKLIANNIDKPAQNAVFVYDLSTLRASAFQPHQTGFGVDQNQLKQAIKNQLAQLIQPETLLSEAQNSSQDQETTNIAVQMIIQQTEPEISLKDTNNLGINELVGFGESYYTGSISTRSHNITVASAKLNYALVPPGEEFSFNKTVGPVTTASGFKDAYVIRSGRTLLESGGGVCQVSSTMFRAMLDAGVNITLRLPHSYRVSYYELENKPGFDATVYTGNVDLRFINDTPGYLLVVADADPDRAYATVRIYGTSDGRHAEIGGYKQWGYTAPPPPQDIPDPNLAPGQRKQIENAIPGLKTSFDWTVFDQSGNIIHQKTFTSHYHAWGAKFLIGI
ncbi:MAG TPA: VanW family protein, partial [Candidatus Woesebacteria bacterium]|nr:VanW family protein [Candidatus Woesebacteria bacterium]